MYIYLNNNYLYHNLIVLHINENTSENTSENTNKKNPNIFYV